MKGETNLENLLTAEHICKNYPGFALRDISFYVAPGTVTGLIGPNGAGKTTTLRILLGLSPFAEGRISYFGLGRDASDPQIRARIGAVLDGGSFFEDLTADQMMRIISKGYRSWNAQVYRKYMGQFGLDPRKKLSSYSRGMHAKFALVLALSHEADFLVMDEPTAGLDPLVRRELLDVLQEFMSDGRRSILFSTHITSDLDRIADEIILLDNGHLVFQENKDDLLERFRIVKGTSAQLTPQVRALLADLKETPFGFTGITDDAPALRKLAPELVTEHCHIEDVMAASTSPGKAQSQPSGGKIHVGTYL